MIFTLLNITDERLQLLISAVISFVLTFGGILGFTKYRERCIIEGQGKRRRDYFNRCADNRLRTVCTAERGICDLSHRDIS